MHKEFEVGPHGLEGGFAPDFEDAAQQNQHPAGDAKERGYVLTCDLLGDFFDFGFPLVHEGHIVRGGRPPTRPHREVVDHDGAQVAVVGVLVELVDLRRAAQPKAEAIVELGIRNLFRIKREQVAPHLKVVVFEGLVRNRNEFRLRRCGSGTLGKPLGDARPEHVGFAAHAPLDPGVELVVVDNGHCRRKLGVGGRRREPVRLAVVGLGRRGHEHAKHLVLGRQGRVAHGVQARNPAAQAPVNEVGDG